MKWPHVSTFCIPVQHHHIRVYISTHVLAKCPLYSTSSFYCVSGLKIYKNTCLCFSTYKLYEIYVFNSVQNNSKRFLRTFCTGEKFERYLADFRQRIIEAVELITPHMLINTWQELEYRLDICRATTGAHIEVYGRA